MPRDEGARARANVRACVGNNKANFRIQTHAYTIITHDTVSLAAILHFVIDLFVFVVFFKFQPTENVMRESTLRRATPRS